MIKGDLNRSFSAHHDFFRYTSGRRNSLSHALCHPVMRPEDLELRHLNVIVGASYFDGEVFSFPVGGRM
jgi:hypothetical protein